MREVCAKCGHVLVKDRGYPDAHYILVGEFPGQEEIYKGAVMVGEMGKMLSTELSRACISPLQLRLTNLWQHAPTFGKLNKSVETECLKPMISSLYEKFQAEQVKGVMLMGSDCIRWLTDLDSLEDWSSLDITTHMLAPLPAGVWVMCMANPAIAFHGGVGETRLALQRFKERMDQE